MRRGTRTFWLVIHIVFGLYFINVAFEWIRIPGSVTGVDKWITFVGGLLVFFGAINFMRATRYNAIY